MMIEKCRNNQAMLIKINMKTEAIKNILLCMSVYIFILPVAMAHSPICDCYDNGDETVTCEGGFSDGSSATGVAIRIVNTQGKVLLAGKMDDKSNYSYKKPEQEYHVIFDAGDNHTVTIYSEDIEE